MRANRKTKKSKKIVELTKYRQEVYPQNKNIVILRNTEEDMRVPIKGDDYFTKEVNSAFERIKDAYIDGAKCTGYAWGR